MINSLADLLLELKNKETEMLKKYDMLKHGPMIGDMYEGLTKSLLEKSIFNNMDIKVVSGKIINDELEMSNQIDCMIVEGSGEKIPYTENYLYKTNQVIAVIEVKKNLYAKELGDSYQNLKSVIDVNDPNDVTIDIVRDSFRNICKKELPDYKEITDLSIDEQYVYHSLVVEAALPVRIVLGYYGYASEFSLREGFINYISENLTKDSENPIKGFGPSRFPNLIICRENSLIKFNGMPYSGELLSDGFMDIYGSRKGNPVLLLLELIWTRLAYRYELPSSIFGEDLETEVFNKFLKCRISTFDDQKGWEFTYSVLSDKELVSYDEKASWEPWELTLFEFIILNQLCEGEVFSIKDKAFVEELKNEGYTIDDFIKKLNKMGIIYVDKNNNLELLTDQLLTIILPDGRFIAGENKTGRLDRWVRKYMEQRNKSI